MERFKNLSCEPLHLRDPETGSDLGIIPPGATVEGTVFAQYSVSENLWGYRQLGMLKRLKPKPPKVEGVKLRIGSKVVNRSGVAQGLPASRSKFDHIQYRSRIIEEDEVVTVSSEDEVRTFTSLVRAGILVEV